MPFFLDRHRRNKWAVLFSLLTLSCFICATHLPPTRPPIPIVDPGPDSTRWGNILNCVSLRLLYLANWQGTESDSIEFIDECSWRMKAALCYMKRIAQSKHTYAISYVDSGVGFTDYDPKRHMVIFHVDSMQIANFIHEATHGEQFEIGSIAYTKDSGKGYGDDCLDEVDAYKQQFAFDPASVTGLDRPALVHSFADITIAWVKKHHVYDLTPEASIDVNADTLVLNRLYPQHHGGWKSRSAHPLRDKNFYLFNKVRPDTCLETAKTRMGA